MYASTADNAEAFISLEEVWASPIVENKSRLDLFDFQKIFEKRLRSVDDTIDLVNPNRLEPLDYMMDNPYTEELNHHRFTMLFDLYNRGKFDTYRDGTKVDVNKLSVGVEILFYRAMWQYKIANTPEALVAEKIKTRSEYTLKMIRDQHLSLAYESEKRFVEFIEKCTSDQYQKNVDAGVVTYRLGFNPSRIYERFIYVRKDHDGGDFDPSIDTAFYKQMYTNYFEKYLNAADQNRLTDAALDSLYTAHDFAQLEKDWRGEAATVQDERERYREKKANEGTFWEKVGTVFLWIVGLAIFLGFLFLIIWLTVLAIQFISAYFAAGAAGFSQAALAGGFGNLVIIFAFLMLVLDIAIIVGSIWAIVNW